MSEATAATPTAILAAGNTTSTINGITPVVTTAPLSTASVTAKLASDLAELANAQHTNDVTSTEARLAKIEAAISDYNTRAPHPIHI